MWNKLLKEHIVIKFVRRQTGVVSGNDLSQRGNMPFWKKDARIWWNMYVVLNKLTLLMQRYIP